MHEGNVAALGRRLWAWLFPPPVEALYRAALAGLPSGGGLRLRLRLDAPELAALPWELGYDPVRGRFPALSAATPVVRYVPLPYRPGLLAGPAPLNILFVGASPADLDPLDVQIEKDLLLAALADYRDKGRVVVDALPEPATVEALQDALRGGHRALHFSGHGQAGHLLLEDEDRFSHPVGADALAMLLGDSGVALAVLNACDSGTQPGGPFAGVAPALVRAGLPAVVAMQAPMPDRSARAFARSLYAALAGGWPLDAAVTEGRKAVALAVGLNAPDWAMPVLYLRAPDGMLWEFDKDAEPKEGRVDESGDVYENITISGGVVGAIGGRGHRIRQGTGVGAESPSHERATSEFDLAVVRDLLLAAFTASDLRRLSLYASNAELRPLVQEFGTSDGLSAMADKTVEFCVTRDLLPALLQEVRRANPRQYARYAAKLRGRGH